MNICTHRICEHVSLLYDSHAGSGDLVDVSRYLIRLNSDQIFLLGLILGLHATPTLGIMRQSRTFLSDMLTEWLQGKDDVLMRGGHTWRTLVNALRDPQMNQNEIADKIEREKCQTF